MNRNVLYTYGVGKSIILESELKIGEWVFDVDASSIKNNIEREDWINIIEDLSLFLSIAKENLSIDRIYVEVKNLDMRTSQFDVIFRAKSLVETVADMLTSLIKNDNSIFNRGYEIELKCFGKCQIDEEYSVYSNLINIRLVRNHNVCVAVGTNNLSYLPHNPVTMQRQYDLWKYNAPKLARTIYEFGKKSKLILLSGGDEIFPLGFFCQSNIFYLMNRAIIGVDDPEWDEFHIPFELLDEKDYKFE